MRAKITKRRVDALRPGDILVDDGIKGFVARRLNSGVVSYGFRYRHKTTGRQRWIGLGLHGSITPDEARDLAKRCAGEVAAKRDPMAERKAERAEAARARDADASTVDAILDNFLIRYVRKNALRRGDEVERVFKVYVRSRIGKKSIYELRRRDVVEMLDAIEDENGPVMADRVLAHVRKAFNWQAARDDRFIPPIVRGMARTKPLDRARKRVLSDEEIRDLWKALDEVTAAAPFPAYVRALLLTAQRRDEVARMRWEEIEGETWIIPAERYKTNVANAVPLTEAVRALLGTLQKKGYVFSTTKGKRPFSGFSKPKQALDEKIAELRKKDERKPMPHWVLHDLRRTARSLMSRAGVPSDIAERVLGHAIPGVRGIYDRHSYEAEKRDALERLANLVNRILNLASNIVSSPATA
ncbi:MAG: tyrosine-type recombinase/integrase [Alphaproteobacteria bacterium]